MIPRDGQDQFLGYVRRACGCAPQSATVPRNTGLDGRGCTVYCLWQRLEKRIFQRVHKDIRTIYSAGVGEISTLYACPTFLGQERSGSPRYDPTRVRDPKKEPRT